MKETEDAPAEPRRLCTCATPSSVDITEAFWQHCCSSIKKEGNEDANLKGSMQALLVPILQRYGWAIVTIDPSRVATLAETNSEDTSWLRDSTLSALLSGDTAAHKKVLSSFFQSSSSTSSDPPQNGPLHGIYRQAESGSSEEGFVEPKESWEVQRTHLSDHSSSQHPLYNYMQLLHHVGATVVEECLGFPSNTVLAENDKESLDLMRAFHYHSVAKGGTPVMGSSEHTDWGSLTVVWQDDIGGLETYCHAKQKWNAVPAASHSNSEKNSGTTMSFVIHVSDATSVASARKSINSQINNDDDQASSLTTWPSPRHRVVSPTEQSRTSLVYFAYPPPSLSLDQLGEALQEQKQLLDKHTKASREELQEVLYDDYFLLRNQAASGKSISAFEQLQAIWKQPLKQVFLDKWQQVQRSEDTGENLSKDMVSENNKRCLWNGAIQIPDPHTISYDTLWEKYARVHTNHPSWMWHASQYLVVVQEVSLSYVFFLFNQVSLNHSDFSQIQQGVDRSVVLLVITLLLVVILNYRGQPKRMPLRQKARQRLTDAGLIGIVLKFLSNLLCSLTASYADDAVETLALICMLLHLVTVDYGYANGQARESPAHHSTNRPIFQGGTLSLNAAFLATLLWMSRLENQNLTAFSTCLLAVVVFAFFPQTRHELSVAYPPSSNPAMALITALLVLACGNLAIWTRSESEVRLYLSSIVALVLAIPLWKAQLQVYKVALKGPWDIPKL